MRRAFPGIVALALSLALASCAGPTRWTKPGVSNEQASADYSDCRSQAQHDIIRDVNIDTDIAASRQQDWARSQSTDTHLASDAAINNQRTDTMLKSCMEGKGYAPGGTQPTISPGWWPFPLF